MRKWKLVHFGTKQDCNLDHRIEDTDGNVVAEVKGLKNATIFLFARQMYGFLEQVTPDIPHGFLCVMAQTLLDYIEAAAKENE